MPSLLLQRLTLVNIFCAKKPMAMTVAETEEMAKAVRANDVIFMMGFVNRFRAESKVIKALAEEGKFGDIYYAKTGIIRRRGTPLGLVYRLVQIWWGDLSSI